MSAIYQFRQASFSFLLIKSLPIRNPEIFNGRQWFSQHSRALLQPATSSLALKSALATEYSVKGLVLDERPEAPAVIYGTPRWVDLISNDVNGHHHPENCLEIIFEDLKSNLADIWTQRTTTELDGYSCALKAREDGANVLFACGGDGTVAAADIAIKDRK